jgi:hypothetical protein
MKKFVVLLLLSGVFLFAAPANVEVFISEAGGSHYHTSTCSRLPAQRTSVTLGAAVNGGYARCNFCLPPRLGEEKASSYSLMAPDDKWGVTGGEFTIYEDRDGDGKAEEIRPPELRRKE